MHQNRLLYSYNLLYITMETRGEAQFLQSGISKRKRSPYPGNKMFPQCTITELSKAMVCSGTLHIKDPLPF